IGHRLVDLRRRGPLQGVERVHDLPLAPAESASPGFAVIRGLGWCVFRHAKKLARLRRAVNNDGLKTVVPAGALAGRSGLWPEHTGVADVGGRSYADLALK